MVMVMVRRLLLTSCNYTNYDAWFQKTIHYTSNIDYKEDVIRAIQCYYAISDGRSISIIFSCLMLCYGYRLIIKSDAEHKRTNKTSKFHVKKQVFRNPSYATH
ncbi:hypothetical protein T11_13130 [Trichinella zimbabwensis]|uniref:Uncharacterized protein n=1 Tax=Trichinella zimbabwensis TaxID=268475 RepID=A0A0V1HWR7_9BILA|nr:hypothetical protein T11_13130 [Trichinella zimbabwensis]